MWGCLNRPAARRNASCARSVSSHCARSVSSHSGRQVASSVGQFPLLPPGGRREVSCGRRAVHQQTVALLQPGASPTGGSGGGGGPDPRTFQNRVFRPHRFENEVANIRCFFRFLGYFGGRLATLPTIDTPTQKSVATPMAPMASASTCRTSVTGWTTAATSATSGTPSKRRARRGDRILIGCNGYWVRMMPVTIYQT